MTQLVMEPDSSEEEQKAKGKKGKKEKKVAVKKEAKEPTLESILVTAASKDLPLTSARVIAPRDNRGRGSQSGL